MERNDDGLHNPPTMDLDDELLIRYLSPSSRKPPISDIIPNLNNDVDIYEVDPWELPKQDFGEGEEPYCSVYPLDKIYRSGIECRKTPCGYWSASGGDRSIMYLGLYYGVARKLEYYTGPLKEGRKTSWVMHEWMLKMHSDVFCVIFNNTGLEINEPRVPQSIITRLADYHGDVVSSKSLEVKVVAGGNKNERGKQTIGGVKLGNQNVFVSIGDQLRKVGNQKIGGVKLGEISDDGLRSDATDEQLAIFFLAKSSMSWSPKMKVDIYEVDPWELAELGCRKFGDEYYCYHQLDEKYWSGIECRKTPSGYWRPAGRDKSIEYLGKYRGKARKLEFYVGPLQKGRETPWVMHECMLNSRVYCSHVFSMIFENTDPQIEQFRLTPKIRFLLLHACQLRDFELAKKELTSTLAPKTILKGKGLVNESFPLSKVGIPTSKEQGGKPAEEDDVPHFSNEDLIQETDRSIVGVPGGSSTPTRLLLESDSDSDSSVSELLVMFQAKVTGNESLDNDTGKTLLSDFFAALDPQMMSFSASDAQCLFLNQVRDVIDDPEIARFAQLVVDKCCYSRSIISAVGSALAAESSTEEWQLVAQIQGSPGTSNTDDCLNPHIKYCYDRLKANDVKRCFLYSALLLEHKQILFSVLAESLVNANLLGGRTVAASKRANDIVEWLIQVSLLEVNNMTRMVKMDDVIIDSAIAILSSSVEGCQMFSRPGLSWLGGDQSRIHSLHRYLIEVGTQLKKPPPLQEWDQATMIFLMDNQFSTLPEKPNCPTLVSLFLQRNPYLRVIPASFFDSMLTLTNLDLSETRIRSLPDSLFNLKSLQVLLLRYCEHLIMLPSAIRQLKSLQVLDLQGTELTYLPDEVGELSNLKSLKVSFYGSINHKECSNLPTKLVGDGIISSLRLLEDLGMFVFPGDQRWNDVVSQIIKEVACLMLCTISFHFSKLESLDYFLDESKSWKNEDVTEFNFIVGHDFKHTVSLSTGVVESMHSSSERCLRLVNGETIPHGVVEILKRATSLYLDHHLSVSHLTDFGIDNMNALRICIISDCPKFVAISHLDLQRCEEAILPSLEYMSLNSLWNFKSVTLGRQVAEKGSFQMLRYLSICSCSKLIFVFTLSMGTNLGNLEELVIEDCVSLKYVFIQDDMTNGDGDIIDAPSDTNPQNDGAFVVLRSLQVATFRYLPNLLGIGRITYPNMQSPTFYNCPKLDDS